MSTKADDQDHEITKRSAAMGPEEAATATRGVEGRGAPPSRTPSAPATRWVKMGVEEKRESAPEEAMEEEEWAPGQVVRKVGGQDGSWLFLFPLFGCGFLCLSLPVVGRPTMTG